MVFGNNNLLFIINEGKAKKLKIDSFLLFIKERLITF
jgi:hypothetical protein